MDGNKVRNRKYSLDSLGYSLECGGSLLKSKECKMRRSSEGMKGHGMDDAHFELLSKSLQRGSATRKTSSTIEEEGATHVDGLLIRNSFKNHTKTFHKHFPEIAEMEDLINAFTCALHKEVLYHGKMYMSQQHVCFYSSVLLKETKVQIHIPTIQVIKKKNTARVVPNAISIITSNGEKYVFGSLRNRDVCFNVLRCLCPQLQHVNATGSPLTYSAENSHELEISSHSSQEDSADPHKFSVSGQDTKTSSNVALLSSVSSSSSGEARNSSTSSNRTRDEDTPEENTAVSWVAMVTEKIRSLLSMGGTTNVNKLVIVYLILVMLLLLSSGYIGLRIAALEEQLNTLGATTEFGLQTSVKET